MLEIFRQNYFLNSLLLLPYSLLLGIDSFVRPVEISLQGTSPLFTLTFGWLEGSPIINAALACFLIFLQAVMINRLVIKHRLSRIISLIPGLVYVVLMNAVPEVRGIHPLLIGNMLAIFFLLSAFQILRLYATEKLIFNMGFWAVLALFFYPAYGMLFILIILCMQILRSLSYKEIGQSLSGVICALILLFSWFYIRDDAADFWLSFGHMSLENWWNLVSLFSWPSSTMLWTLYVLIGLAIMNYYNLLGKQTIKEQKKINLTYWFLLLAIFGMLWVPALGKEGMLLTAIPLAVILGIILANWQQKMGAEIIHLLVVLGIVYLHFQ